MPVFARGKTDGTFNMQWVRDPGIKSGNAEFLDPNPACLVQLRPMRKSETCSNGAGRKANAILMVRGEGITDLALYVRVPPHLLKNNRAGVVRAMRCVDAFDRSIAAMIWEKIGRSRWPSREAWSWK
ncbi:hypothetical protein [Methylobacterium sp. NEAU K]|uniref:hypothetical protein n=1 Tax=Methylobacterium sp. NEAU K TaxID=3064946 RepID=UPI002736BCA3|nr:hypothetical protein [Methylobacterium sp. NEAU K]MDP4005781.1 hypothetical protein [Methylobacterium sp. NEAU K]